MFILSLFVCCLSQQPKTPQWPSSVIVNPSQGDIDQYYKRLGGNSRCCGVGDGNGQFSKERVAFLFTSGYHNVNVKVGYYTSVIGLGDATIQGLRTDNCYSNKEGALSNFWRSVENIKISSSVTYAVSQACPMRGVTIQGDLMLSQGGYTSGGFLADSTISGNIYSGSQQQFYTRNSEFRSSPNGVWNMVFSGCPNAGSSTCYKRTVVKTVPIIAKKPYITKDSGGYKMIVPNVEKDSSGRNTADGKTIDFSSVYVANSEDLSGLKNAFSDSTIMAVVLTPGIYKLDEPLRINMNNFILFGMGMANLIAPSGESALIVNATGVRISGLLVEPSGSVQSSPLVVFGLKGQKMGSEDNPSFIHDVFTRVGRFQDSTPTRADMQLQINMDWVVIDNIWLWRADHDIIGEVYNEMSPAYVGLEVNGDHVHGYGLAVEHNLHEQVIWNGENGYVTFFQSELPYDAFSHQYAGYRVNSNVKNHTGRGMGCYSNFQHSVNAPYGFAIGGGSGIILENLMTVFLNGQGQIDHVINSDGSTASGSAHGQPQYVCNPNPGSAPTPPAPTPGNCTPKDSDPYSTGKYLGCCSGLVSCLKKWDSNRAPYYKCETSNSGCNGSGVSSQGTCYHQQGNGNGKCGATNGWTKDTWGEENLNSGASKQACLARKSGNDGHCGTDSCWCFAYGSSNSCGACNTIIHTDTQGTCYHQQGNGNGRCGATNGWAIDTWGEEHLSSDASKQACLSRKAGNDGYCGTDSCWCFAYGSSKSCGTCSTVAATEMQSDEVAVSHNLNDMKRTNDALKELLKSLSEA